MSGTVSVSLPAELASLFNRSGADLDVQVREALALHLFQQGRVSSRTAALLLGISWDSFLELLAERNIPYFNQTIDEVLQDAEVAARALAERQAG